MSWLGIVNYDTPTFAGERYELAGRPSLEKLTLAGPAYTLRVEGTAALVALGARIVGPDGVARPLLASPTQRLSNPRLSPDGRWLAFDAAPPGGSPSVFVTRMQMGSADGESGWIRVASRASHAFWSRDGRLLYYLPTTPTVDIRNKVVARAFDVQNGRAGLEELEVMTLSETIVPALITAAAPIVAGEQIIFCSAITGAISGFETSGRG